MMLPCVKVACLLRQKEHGTNFGLDEKGNAILCEADLFLHRQEQCNMYGSKLCIPSECLVERGKKTRLKPWST